FPFGKAVDEPAGRIAPAVQFAHRVVGVDAIGPAAVRDDLGTLRKRSEVTAQLGDGNRTRAGDVPGLILGAGPYIEHDDFSTLQAGGQLGAVHDVDVAGVTQIRLREAFEPRGMSRGDIS